MVKREVMTDQERELRELAYWTVCQQDIVSRAPQRVSHDPQLRAIGAGRPPMLPESNEISLPRVDAEVDAAPWMSPSGGINAHDPLGKRISGVPGLRSSIFRENARLLNILKKTMLAV